MALTEKITQKELILYEILRNPLLCSEFTYNIDLESWEEPFIFTEYQREILCDFNEHVSIATARATGKTESETALINWLLLFNVFPNDYVVYTVPSKVHLQPVWQNLTRKWKSNSFLKEFLPVGGGFNSSDYRLELRNKATLICRIAGQTGTGANVIGLHTPFVLLDEGGYYPWGTWVELQPIVNTFTQGSRLMVAGVPTGVREKNVLYKADMEDSTYTKHRVSAYENPRFTKEDEQHAIEQYGGKDSDDFIHLVLGEHGSPLFSIFDRNLMDIESYKVYKYELNGVKLKEDTHAYLTKLSTLPSLPDGAKYCIIGVDLGYTEPTAIVIMYMTREGRLKFHARIQLDKVSYSVQPKIIDYLDSKYQPSIIGIDEGSSGKAVVHIMQESEDFIHKDYHKRLIPINFSSQVELGYDSEGKEQKAKTKPFSVSVLQEYSNNGRIVYSTMDLEMVSELERMTYSKNPNGDISYKTLTTRGGKRGDDHFTSALLCAALAYYLENEALIAVKKPVKLFTSKWIY